MYLKTVEEVSEALAKRYDGPTYEREGQGGKKFTYIPWHVSVRLLDSIFGPFGWSTTQPLTVTADGVVTVTVGITVRVYDHETESVIEKTVPGVGSAVARDDNSAKSALSDALSKGVKFLGDAFGFFLSEEKGGGQQQQGGARPQSRPAAQGDGPTPAQLNLLRRKGATEEQIAGLRSKKDASDLIESLQWVA